MQSKQTSNVITPISKTSTTGSSKIHTWSDDIDPQTPPYDWTTETPTPLKHIMKTDQLDDILQQLKLLQDSMNNITSTVKKEVNVAKENKLSNTISNRAKEEVKCHLAFLSKQPLKDSPQKIKDESDNSSTSSSSTLINPKDTKDNFEFMPELVNMPHITYKSYHSHKKSNSKKCQFEYPVSPLDVQYQVGCNDDLFSLANHSNHTQTSSQQKASNHCQEWLHQA